MFADLHLHTSFSDGTYSPEELAGHARHHDLATVSLTDHDTVEGCQRMAAACAGAGLEFISGTELTADLRGHELHMLGYGIDYANVRLLNVLAVFQGNRQARIHEMVARLKKMGVSIEAEDVFALAGCRSVGRPHLARTLIQAGVCATLDEAFERFLKKNRPAWVPKPVLGIHEVIELIHHAGGLAVMAHPGLGNHEASLPDAIAAGIDGIECFHTRHPPAASERYLALAATHGLLVTGGSDCHGMNKGRPLIGSVRLPYAYVQALKSRLNSGRAAAK
jgi:hypothetical protein